MTEIALSTGWVATWAASPMNVWAADMTLPGFYNQTIREFVRISLGGHKIRVRISNEFGSKPVAIEAACVALAGEDGAIQPLTVKPLSFGGEPGVLIPAGAPALSDAVELMAPSQSRLALSFYVSGFLPLQTHHYEAQQTTLISIPGNFVNSELVPLQQRATSHFLASVVFVDANERSRAVACIGDSITDGYGSQIDGDKRWPDVLSDRFYANALTQNLAVLNLGIGGNRLLTNGRGANALARFDRDVLGMPRVSHVVIQQGINDIGWPGTSLAGSDEVVTAQQIIFALQQLVARAEINGIRAIIGTLTPFEGTKPEAPIGDFYTHEKDRARTIVNAWIRRGEGFHGVVDFDAAIRDPARPSRLLPAYDCGDHLHPNDAGYRAMAQAIDLGQFT
jgi:lysophospholipase L1-like esterase